ncbi:STAS/SEC14 domain-containing protein [Idiomarina sp. HP20-50]|uniref:STAS/SEC14 domain-containing protein n=1 Tax=Idiomarina sp. HP20-50 TaxID=3070813 RepID=UPI00294AEFF5|nr:STAS/SEC14 domain-containing protein [Idiomarina sp. HP20-50]MDV6315326.1 STAS/SEC14 domain-containing protein [Idiomarina sp. HP20-50]
MIDVKQIPGTNIVEMFVEGKATAEEFDAALKTFENVIKERGSIKVLEVIGDLDMPPIPWSKFIQDIKFSFEHLSDISHVAVVADQGWIATWVNMMNPLFKADMKVFKQSDIDQAREWLSGGS